MPGKATQNSQSRPGWAFSLFTGGLICLFSLALAFGVMHESSQPTVFGRYSGAYFALLLALAALVALLTWLLISPRPAGVRWAGNLYALLVSTIVAMTAAEIGLRLVNPWGMEFFSLLPYHMQGMIDHPQLGYAHPRSISYQLGSNRVSLNSHGHRDDEMPVDKPAGEHRILILGDSVAFGWGVDQWEDFPARLEALLRNEQGDLWQVINTGVNGYNSEQEAIYIATEGIRFKPDIVLLVLVSNDADPVFDPNAVTWRRYPNWPSSLPELLDRARSVSYLYQATKLFQRMEEVRPLGPNDPRPSVTDHPRWPVALDALKSIGRLCEREQIPLLVALLGADERAEDSLRLAGIATTSLGPSWSNVVPQSRYVSRIDPHPSPAVHQQIAKQLMKELLDRGWLKAAPRQ
jgi:hypothetical protein